ncbi:lysine-specific demethylase hairless isoform X2 [Microcaecilia unicolor]|uniref:Lysine-specific demethylase n=1 Tax=Microcaecilia unicolor TaxID=1415580 RepID=A0A6P7XY31_9AMPH|nr:lysine-specific demethylase hairless isoform X2 [Microcaecilia unicolor]
MDTESAFTPLKGNKGLRETSLILAERILGADDIGILTDDRLGNLSEAGIAGERLTNTFMSTSESTLPELPYPEKSSTLWVEADRTRSPNPRHHHEGPPINLDHLHPPVIGRIMEDCSKRLETKVRDIPSPLSQNRRNSLSETRPDSLELQSHLRSKHGEANKKWVQRNKEGLSGTWVEGRPARYGHAFLSLLPLSGLQDPNATNAGLSQGASKQEASPASHSVLDNVQDHSTLYPLNPSCPFLIESKLFDRQAVSVPSINPANSLVKSTYPPTLAPFIPPHEQKAPSALGEASFTKPNWHLPTWSHHNYQGSYHGGRIPAVHENCFSSRKKAVLHRKDAGFHFLVKDPTVLSPRLQPVLLNRCPSSAMGSLKLLQDNQMERLLYPELKRDPSWKTGGLNIDVRTSVAHGKDVSNCMQINRPLVLVKQSTERPAGFWPASSLPVDPSVAIGADSREESQNSSTSHPSMEPGSQAAEQDSFSPQPTQNHNPTNTSAGELCQNSMNNGSSWECQRPYRNLVCSNNCSSHSHCASSSRMATTESESKLGQDNKVGTLSVLMCPPYNHTKLKNTWLSRHYNYHASCNGDRQAGSSETANVAPELKTLKRDMLESAEKAGGFSQKQATKRTHGKELRASQSAKRSFRITHHGQSDDAPCQRAEPKDTHLSRINPDSGDSHVQRGKIRQEDTGVQMCRETSQEKQGATSLQSVPCSALPSNIERCCRCEAGSHGREETPAENLCRFLHFRRLVLGCTGELRVDGLPTLNEADSDGLKEMKPRELCRSPSPARYLLSTLGDIFCEMVRRDREALLGATSGGEIAWRRNRPNLHICDICRTSFFNTHWSCSRCGSQLCFQCYQLKKEKLDQDLQENEVPALRCGRGQQHSSCSFVPTQFISTNALTDLWKTLHDVRAKFAIRARCSCNQKNLADTLLMGITLTKEKEVQVHQSPAPPAAETEEPAKCSASMKDSTESSQQSPSAGGAQRSVQASTLCDLLTSTAVKLCLGQNGVRMAFAPVSPSLRTDERINSILDNIITQVVERKIQEKKWEEEGVRTPRPPESVSSYPSSQGGVLWLHDPSLRSNYRRFQEHWRRCQPVLVSGLERMMKRSLWGPESLSREFGEQEALTLSNCCTPTKINSKEFWDRFTGRSDAVDVENCRRSRLTWEYNLGEQKSSWTENLTSSLPLPEYCRNDGMLNLASYLPAEESRSWLGPRISAVYGEKADERNIGTKPLTAQAADFLNILVYVEAIPLCDRHSILQDILERVEADGMDSVLKERLWDAKCRPGALWHIFQAEDSECIQSFLQKQLNANQSQQTGPQTDPSGHTSHYLDLSLRKQLREDLGVKCRALLQFQGDAVLIPAGCPYQVQCFSSNIGVTQGFLSPENAAYSAHLLRTGRHSTSAQSLYPQMEGAIFGAVKDAMETLQRYI